jgi:hypothetical protein
MADKLPMFPKLKNGKVIQKDSNGRIIYVDHFRELKQIQEFHMNLGKASNHPDILKEWATYSRMVMGYDKYLKSKQGLLGMSTINLIGILIVVLMTMYALVVFVDTLGINDFIKNLTK